MAYQTGAVGNSHNLVDKIYGFLLSIGWQHVATLKTGEHNPAPDGYDFVFYSSGKSGADDIYIRIAAGESDLVSGGDIQHPYTDGYTGFINAFAYQHFPSGGTSPEDGHNEIGRYGPILYVAPDTGTSPGYVYEFNMSKSTSNVPRSRTYEIDDVRQDTAAFDGKRFLYQRVTSSDSLNSVDLYDSSVADKNYSTTNSGSCETTPYIRQEDGTEYIYQTSSVIGAGQDDEVIQRYDIANDSWTYSGIDGPPWGSELGTSGCMCAGVRRKRQDSNYWLYFFRGLTSGGGTTQWAQFDLKSKRWTGLNSPSAPFTLGGGWGTINPRLPCCLFIAREQSGYEHDRIYIWQGNSSTGFASIPIDDDGYVLSGASWAIHSSTPYTQFSGMHATCIGRTILTGGSSGAPKALYKWELPTGDPTSSGSWSQVDDEWLDYDLAYGPQIFHAHHHLCGRVKVSEFESNTYWMFADLDHLVIVVKNSGGEYEYLYAGRFQPYANEINATLLSTVNGGTTSIKVDLPDLFTVGRKYMISDTTGEQSSLVSNSITGVTKRLAPSEIFTVLANDGSGELIVSRINSDYYAGSKVGEDPTPVMIRAQGMEKAQTFDTINLVDIDGYTDAAWQTYSLRSAVSDSFADTTDQGQRSLETYLYAIVLINEGDAYTGREVRGQLIDVYSCGTAISSEEEVSVGSRTYLAFEIAESGQNQRIVVGPKT